MRVVGSRWCSTRGSEPRSRSQQKNRSQRKKGRQHEDRALHGDVQQQAPRGRRQASIGARLRGVRARRLARLEPLRPGQGERGSWIREGDQEDARRLRHRDLCPLEPPLLADGASVQRLVTRRVGRNLRQGGDVEARPRADHQDRPVRERARDQDGLRVLRVDRVGELVHLAAAAARHLREGLGPLRRALGPDPRRVQEARRAFRTRGASHRDRLQRLHCARGGQASRP